MRMTRDVGVYLPWLGAVTPLNIVTGHDPPWAHQEW
jgi:hypothetical protein